MPQHISRKELKKDEVQQALAHSAEAVLSHQKLLTYLLIAAVAAGLGVFGWKRYSERQSVKAAGAFSGAMQVFQAPVTSAGETAAPGELSYTKAANKYQDALKKFQDVANRYPRTKQGQFARYYLALCFEHLGKDAEATQSLAAIENSADPDVSALARFELAQIDDRTGKGAAAVKLYNDLVGSSSVLVPKPVVLLALAEHYSQSNPAQAARIYDQIKSEFPDTGAADQADHALALLPSGKS